MSHLWLAVGVAAVGFSLLFALAHHALRHFSRARLEEALARRGRLPELQQLFEHHEELTRTTGLLWILSLMALALASLAYGTRELGTTTAGWAAGAAGAALAALVFGGVVPMAWARYAGDAFLARALPLLQACRRAFLPADRVLGLVDLLVRRLLGVAAATGPGSHIEEEIRSVVSEGEREGTIEEDQKDMIESVIEFKKADATEIMTPRTDIVSIEADARPPEARTLVNESGHSRIPVIEGNIDTIVGILYAKDLLQVAGRPEAEDVSVRELMRKPLFVPETKKLDELLHELQLHKVHIAVVLDEYGGTAGLVTIEDIIEEIFGDIVDEYEEAPPEPIRRVDDRAFEVEARVHIDELNDELDLELPEDEDFETIGGFVLSRLGTIPKAGEVLDERGVRITVTDAEERRITRLRIDLAPEPATPEEE